MYIRPAVLFSVIALAGAAVAAPSALEARGGNCDTGSIQCCNQAVSPSDPSASALLGLLGINLSGITGLVGLDCVPIVGTNKCDASPVCCTGNNFNGVVVIGCSPITIL